MVLPVLKTKALLGLPGLPFTLLMVANGISLVVRFFSRVRSRLSRALFKRRALWIFGAGDSGALHHQHSWRQVHPGDLWQLINSRRPFLAAWMGACC